MRTPRALRSIALGAALVAPAVAALPFTAAAQTIAPGTALIAVTGDIEANMVLPIVLDTAAPTEDGFDLTFQDAERNTLIVTFTVDTARISDTFVGVGVPGTSIFDDLYFADYFHTQCTTQTVYLDATSVYAAIDCAGLENGAGDKTIDLHAELTTVGLTLPSASPSAGSPLPSAPAPSSSPQAGG
ncbi:MAG: hypothetical protein ABWZ82_10400 [Candidatus Limnocylindrales bacterium]